MNKVGSSFFRPMVVLVIESSELAACSSSGVNASMECPLAVNLSMNLDTRVWKFVGVF
jgi:hypothetical protein